MARPEDWSGRALIPTFVFGPTLRDALVILYGSSREARVLSALLAAGPLTLSDLARRCGASEHAIRADRAGWIRAIVVRYRDFGIVTEEDRGNKITYELVESTIAVALLRELDRAESVRAATLSPP